ncbi:MAG: hypothetical protein ACP5US_09405 [Candidatus Kryptoniota bacterium]
MLIKYITPITVILIISTSAHADRRFYIWSYQFSTVAPGELELESYSTLSFVKSDYTINSFQQQFELEYGITRRLDVSLYQVVSKTIASPLKLESSKLRGRLKLSEKGNLFVDPLIYLEWVRNYDFKRPNIIEAKIVLAKDVGLINFSINASAEREITKGAELETSVTAGIGYEISPALRLGVESVNEINKEGGGNFGVGPTISASTKVAWITGGGFTTG